MIILALLEGITGIQLFQSGKSFQFSQPIVSDINEIRISAAAMLIVAVFFMVSGIGVMSGKKLFWNLSIVSIILYVVEGILTSRLLLGEALGAGVAINFTIAILLLVFLYLGRKRL